MKMLMVGAGLLFACVFAACDADDGTEPTPTVPAAFGFDELWKLKNQNDFSVLFEGEIEGFEGELLWRKSGDIERWDFFTRLPRGSRPYAGESSIGDQYEINQSCNWAFETRESVEYSCQQVPIFSSLREQFIDPFVRYEFPAGTEEEILGRRASCFEYGIQLPRYASICLDDAGVPLRWSVDGPMELHASEILEPNSDDLTRMPLDVRTPTSLPTVVAAEDLALPEIPSLQAYLSQ